MQEKYKTYPHFLRVNLPHLQHNLVPIKTRSVLRLVNTSKRDRGL